MVARISFVELPAPNLGAARSFYSQAFGWALTDFGPSYSCTMNGETDLGLQGDMQEAAAQPLPVIQVDDLDAAQRAVERAGGRISRAAFGFPGGRRFHFLDPNGLELAAMQPD